ncbi:MAG: Sigma-70 region 4 type 2, partial [Chitinophagaceae bacterium]|nr:Sigma-70 region 4 type 2 [Chitinophagaceae bacterium]
IDPRCDVRTSTGIGDIKSRSKKIKESTAEAFILSGRAFDEIEKSGDQLAIISTAEVINPSLELIALFVNYIFMKLTSKQAEVFLELLNDNSQMGAARKLKKSPSTINKHLQSGGWHELVKILSIYKKIIHPHI